MYAENRPPAIAWHEHALPRGGFRRGPNEVIVRKAPGEKNDDYLYLGIDLSARRGTAPSPSTAKHGPGVC
ncbi:MAG: hypothetical protein IT210_19315 [Armatimonadetes bacterium]|nr:hypothetical protein [Armatimonadota bacterium]